MQARREALSLRGPSSSTVAHRDQRASRLRRQRDRPFASGSRAGKLPFARTLPLARRLSGGAIDSYPRNCASGISRRFDHAWAKSTRTSRDGQLPASPGVGTLTRRLTIDPAGASTALIETVRVPVMSWPASINPSHRDSRGLAGGAWRAPTGRAARVPVDLRAREHLWAATRRAPRGCPLVPRCHAEKGSKTSRGRSARRGPTA